VNLLAADFAFAHDVDHQFCGRGISDGGCLNEVIECEEVLEVDVQEDTGSDGVLEGGCSKKDLGLW